MNRTFGMFWVAAPATYLAFVSWPQERLRVLWGGEGRLRSVVRALQRIDFEGAFQWQRSERAGLAFALHGMTHRGWRAVLWILLCNPVSYMVLVALVMLPQPQPRLAALVAFLILGAVAWSAIAERRPRIGRASAAAAGSARA